ncbi:hypothetical protein FB107DRAFT_279948 [Schizophyllum commune]
MSLRTRLIERDASVKNKAPTVRLVVLALKTLSAKAPPVSGLLSWTHKRYKAAISGDSKVRSARRPVSTLAPVPASLFRSNSSSTTHARGELSAGISEKDVSNVDPEEVPLDYQTIEPGDVSTEIDPAEGFDMVSVTTDIDTLVDGLASALATATGKLKEGAASSGYAT